MRAALGLGLLLLAVACGRHDTPVATYHAPIPEQPSGQAGAAGADSGPPCLQTYPTVVTGLTSRYKEVVTGQSWANAERDCEADGGHLIVIDDSAENDWMTTFAAKSLTDSGSTNQLCWIGLGDSATEETFEWVTGAPLSLALWAAAEPNDLMDDEDCVEIREEGTWNDDHCDAPLTYVCECDGTASPGLWCDSQATESCGDCNSPCPLDQTCFNSKCQ